MHPAGVLIDQRRERVHIGGPELAQLPVSQQESWEPVPLRHQLGQHIGVSRRACLRPLDHRKLQFLEQHVPELLGTVDVERSAGLLVDLSETLDQRS